MNFKSIFQLLIIAFLSILSLGTCYIQINTLKNKYREYYSLLYQDKQNYDFTFKICHEASSTGNIINLRTNISDVKNLYPWNNSFFDFLYSSTEMKRILLIL